MGITSIIFNTCSATKLNPNRCKAFEYNKS